LGLILNGDTEPALLFAKMAPLDAGDYCSPSTHRPDFQQPALSQCLCMAQVGAKLLVQTLDDDQAGGGIG